MAHVIVVGAGAIGSHVLPHLARMPSVSYVMVIDRDRYDETNMATQSITGRDIGRPKAFVQARRLKQISKSLKAKAIDRSIEDLPLGLLRADVILACLDSRRARLVVNQAAWRLGVPWINAGVDATSLLARVQVFVPSPDAACLECAWDTRDYELVEQAYPCEKTTSNAASAAPSALSALAASLQAIECQKLLAGDNSHLLAGCDVVLDARHHRHYVTTFQRNAACRMPDHAGWRITPYEGSPSATTLGELTEKGNLVNSDGPLQVRVAGQRFASGLTCPRCGIRYPAGHVHRKNRRSSSRCKHCRCALTATGFDLQDAFAPAALPETMRSATLAEIGFLPGDVVTLTTDSSETHFELGAVECPTPS